MHNIDRTNLESNYGEYTGEYPGEYSNEYVGEYPGQYAGEYMGEGEGSTPASIPVRVSISRVKASIPANTDRSLRRTASTARRVRLAKPKRWNSPPSY